MIVNESIMLTFLVIFSTFALTKADDCTVTSIDKIEDAVKNCAEIILDSITVPAGEELTLNIKNQNVKVIFRGTTKFEYKAWKGPLMTIQSKYALTVEGEAGSLLDGQGQLYWDGLGSSGTTKPKFFKIKLSEGSIVKNINMKNCPVQCVSIGNSDGVTLDGWNIDNSAGDPGVAASGKEGHNTDGFDVSSSNNVVIQNTVVKNQDDCVAVNEGSNMLFSGLTCHGSHGLSLSVGTSTTTESKNVVSNVTFENSEVINSRNGIHVKTHTNAASGSITDVTYKNIKLSGITNYGINVQEDYRSGKSTGIPVGNIPITNLVMSNIQGSLSGADAIPVYILCGDGGCVDWQWSGISITGQNNTSSCNYKPKGYDC